MDASTTRRGQPCWYHVEGIGLKAVSDAFILEGAIFQMIRKNFRNEPFFFFYIDLVDLMHEVRSMPLSLSLVTLGVTRGCKFRMRQKWDNSLT
jgi:hypothetical protein